MAYLYAGLGVALIIPLMALVQTLVSLAPLEGEAKFLRARRLELINLALMNFEQGLNQAMNADLERLRASSVDPGSDLVIESFFPECAELPEPGEFVGDDLDSIQWLGTYPNCSAVLSEMDGKRGALRRLRVEMGLVKVEEGALNRDLPDPLSEVNEMKQVSREALRVRRSCWVSLATQAQECS